VVDIRALREIYLTGFEIAVKEGKPWGIMSSYNKVNGVYANENRLLLRDILKDEWGFGGMVVSDWGGGNDHCAGVIAGSHLEMPASAGNSAVELVEAVESGAVTETVVDERVDELLTTVFAVQIPKNAPTSFDTDAHHRIARKAAGESIVLLKNENAILPLKKGSKVALIGDFVEAPRFQGAGSSQVNATRVDSALSLIGESGLDCIGFQPGFGRLGKPETKNAAPVNHEAAIALAKQAEVVLFYLGLDEIGESEGLDRANLRIRTNQIELLEAIHQVNPNIVAVLHAGSVVETPWLDKCRALVLASLSGQAGAGAVMDVLIGEICPSGKLSETWPLSLEDSPSFNYYPGMEKTAEYRESIFVGYRYYNTAGGPNGISVRFPFGFGLSYTEFNYSDFSLNNDGAIFTITNTGKTAGAEIAQLYVSLPDSAIFRAQKELKGFARVFLQSGESKTVNISFDDKTFRYFNTATNHFEIEGGAYQVCIGASSRDVRLSGILTVNGTEAVLPRCDPATLPSYFSGQVKKVPDGEFALLLGRTPPPSRWDRSLPLGREDAFAQLFYAKSPFARFIWKILNSIRTGSEAKGKPDLNIFYIYNMPLRGIAKMSGKAVNMSMIDALLEIINGHFFKGLGHLVKEHGRMLKRRKRISLMAGGTHD
jgi:beta-glucosidase